ncbi:MAG: ATP-binding protein [Candidatus Tectimicrobiota bacterium]|nr:MAG: ATP-binding protein [Candidatus Tectomicrobia bacterium]
MTLKDRIWQTLRTVPYPGYSRDVVSFGLVQHVAACGEAATVTLGIGHLAPETREAIVQAVREAVLALPEVQTVEIKVARPSAARAQTAEAPAWRSEIARVLAVGSGKGGVGKSTVAVNLAVALARRGSKVGLLDADVYGPNAPRMLGVERLPAKKNGRLVPAEAYGVKLMSLGLLTPAETPVIWRGPMADKLLRQFLGGVAWGPLDLLVVDLPPGTGDIAISIAQHAHPDSALVVVTPQAVATDDARKAIAMFRRLRVPVLGIVENMSAFVCHVCQTPHRLFGEGGGAQLASATGVPFLGEVPLEPAVRAGGDTGQPAVLQPSSLAGAALDRIAARLGRTLMAETARRPAPTIHQ